MFARSKELRVLKYLVPQISEISILRTLRIKQKHSSGALLTLRKYRKFAKWAMISAI